MKYSSPRIALIALFSTVSAQIALAGEEIDKALDASSDGIVEISNTRGEVQVIGWDEDRVSVTGELDDLAEDFVFEVDGNTTTIKVKLPRRNINWGSGSDLEIRVPEGSQVIFDGVSSDIEAENIQGGLRAGTASGDIEGTGIASRISVKTVSGDIEISESSGQANVSSVSGEITLDVSSDRLMVDTVSGDVDVTLGEFERLMANAVSGDIEVEGRLHASGEIDITSVSSDIQVSLAEPVHARISIETGPGGDITNRISGDPVKKRFPAMKGLDATVGDGTGDIHIRTVSGDIRLDSVD